MVPRANGIALARQGAFEGTLASFDSAVRTAPADPSTGATGPRLIQVGRFEEWDIECHSVHWFGGFVGSVDRGKRAIVSPRSTLRCVTRPARSPWRAAQQRNLRGRGDVHEAELGTHLPASPRRAGPRYPHTGP
jgi:hypothetical protein